MDVVFASFIRKASAVDAIREEMGEKGKHILVVSKVSKYVYFLLCYSTIVLMSHDSHMICVMMSSHIENEEPQNLRHKPYVIMQ